MQIEGGIDMVRRFWNQHGELLREPVSDIPSWALWMLPLALIAAVIAAAFQ
jgi:hypothetical protein